MEYSKGNQENIVGLTILYGAAQDTRYVRYVVGKIPWYLEHGYPVEHILLPRGIAKESSSDDVAQAINCEHSDADYVECAAILQRDWELVSKGFEKMRHEPSFHLGSEYSVVLTKYGLGGSYDTDTNQVIVRINTQSQGGIAGIVTHEIVHMTIQYLIDQYHVRHWHKERLVDLIMEHYFPNLRMTQNIKDDASVVDQAFGKFFPDIEAIAKAVGE